MATSFEGPLSLNSTASHASSNPAAAFITFPGQGFQYQVMASDLSKLQRYPEFCSFDRIWNLWISYLVDAETSCDWAIDNSQVTQICIFVYQYPFCTWLKQLDIEPHAVLGHSLGKITAAGTFDIFLRYTNSLNIERLNSGWGCSILWTGLSLVVTRARLLQSGPAYGGMTIIQQLGLDDGPKNHHAISGEIGAIDTFLSNTNIWGFRGMKINVDHRRHQYLISSYF